MEQRILGQSGLEVTPIALGTWAMGGMVDMWGHVDDRESIAAIQQALDCGINLIDTAPIYGRGHSEDIVGKALHGRRHEAILATKCGLLPPRTKTELPPRCLKPDSIIRECEASLRRLRTDVIDLYQCHWPDPNTPIRETMSALAKLLEEGKIRAIGLSNFSVEEIASAREFVPVHSLQPPFSMLHRRAAQDLIPYCLEHGIAVLAYSPLAKGLLTGKFAEHSKFEGLRSRDPDFINPRLRRHLSVVEWLKPIAASYEKTLTQLVINWTAHHTGITTAIVGAKRPSQVIENAGGIGWKINDEDLARIDQFLTEAEREP